MPAFRVPILLAIALGALVPAVSADEPGRKPNLVLIVADDLGHADVGFHGSETIPTPGIDRIASRGVTFANGYVTAAVCSPSRAGLLTGRYQQRFGHEFNAEGRGNGLPATERTLATELHEAGYATAAVGKWHLGRGAAFHPLARGFDEFFGFFPGGRSYFDHEDAGRASLHRGREAVKEDDYLTDAFGREAVSFVERNRSRPFFLYLAFNAPHTPLEATPTYVDRFPASMSRDRRLYAAMTSAMDDAVGRVLDALKTHGLEEDTLVVFLGDNGGAPRKNAASNAPLRGGKGTLYEGGVRVPFALCWPGRVPAGATFDAPVVSLDVFATALAAAGRSPSPDRPLDGVDLVPHLTGATEAPPHEALYWRSGDVHAVRQGDWKLVVERRGAPELFDLASDVGERRDQAAARPEIAERLAALYDAWDARMVEPLWDQRARR